MLILLSFSCCVYFPTDSGIAQADNTNLNVILTYMSSVYVHVKPGGNLIGGDINYNFNRNNGFVNTVSEYMIDNNLHNVWDAYPLDYTYIHTDNENTFTIDNCLVNSMIYDI